MRDEASASTVIDVQRSFDDPDAGEIHAITLDKSHGEFAAVVDTSEMLAWLPR